MSAILRHITVISTKSATLSKSRGALDIIRHRHHHHNYNFYRRNTRRMTPNPVTTPTSSSTSTDTDTTGNMVDAGHHVFIPEDLQTPLPSSSLSPPKLKPFLTISVDGNISSGKSTLVSTLSELLPNDFKYTVETVPEPLEKWTNMRGHNLLDMLYKDIHRNNFMFQHYVQLTRLMDTMKPFQSSTDDEKSMTGRIRIVERSIQNNRYCFTELARRSGTLHEAEFSVIAEWYKWLDEKVHLPLDLLVYLRTSPTVVFERMKNRGRTEESTVPLEYLTDLHETYEDWLIKNNIEEENCSDSKTTSKYQVIVIDADKSKVEVAEQCQRLIKEYLENRNS